MEDIDREEGEEEEEQVIDIDSSDTKNPLAVTEYIDIDDIYTYYKKMEVKYLLSCSICSKFGLFPLFKYLFRSFPLCCFALLSQEIATM